MRYFVSRFKKDNEERIYRIYMTDSLYYQGRNMTTASRYIDLIKPQKVDNRTGDEIANDVIAKMGLERV